MNNLKAARKKAGLTQKDVAEILNVTPATLSRYESGNIQPDPDTLKTLSNVYRVTIDYLLGKTDLQQPRSHQSMRDETEQKAIDLLNQMPPEMKKAAIAHLEALAALNKK